MDELGKKLKILILGDGVTPTGFSRVLHSIFSQFDPRVYDVHHLAINYWGDPHPYQHKIYPANLKGDLYGVRRLPEFANRDFDIIFILNDLWIISMYLENIKQSFQNLPKIITYSPVDAQELDADWFKHFDVVTQAVAYTQFGHDEIKKVMPEMDVMIIPHGVDGKTFYKLQGTKEEIKKITYPVLPEFYEDSFIVLNASRNQPRKRIDLALEGFALFAKDKPKNVKYHHHAGIVDAGWDVLKLARRYGMTERIILTNKEYNVQRVPDEVLNRIYNATDVGLNTSIGEGWGLPPVEHSVTGAPQIVPANSASKELFSDCGLLIPSDTPYTMERTNTVGRLVKPEDVAEKLNEIYNDKELYQRLSKAGYDKFTDDKYTWSSIARTWKKLFNSVL